MQIFLKFVNFYKHFRYRYFKIAASLTTLFKNNKNEKKKSSFKWSNEVEHAFRQLKDIFISIFFLHYDFLKRNRVKIDAFNFAVASILNQQNKNNNQCSIMFWSRKIIFAKQNYKIYDQEILIIIIAFKQWKHYLKNSFYSIEILSDHNNLNRLMIKKECNCKVIIRQLPASAFSTRTWNVLGLTR